jgi:hypothetical protein
LRQANSALKPLHRDKAPAVNATQKLSENKNVAAPDSALSAIEREWKKRLDGARMKADRHDSPSVGMLATLGYRVGLAIKLLKV